MIERPARVIAIHARSIEVEVDAAAACSQCGSRKACHGGQNTQRFELPLQPGLRAGDTVSLAMDVGSLNLAALLAWLLPALALMLGALLGQALLGTERAAIGTAAIGLACGLFISRQLAQRYAEPHMLPSIQTCFQTPNGSQQ